MRVKYRRLESEIPTLFVLEIPDEALRIKNVVELSFLRLDVKSEAAKNMVE